MLAVLRRYFTGPDAPGPVPDAGPARAVCAELLLRFSLAPRALQPLQEAVEIMAAVGADDRMLQVNWLFLTTQATKFLVKQTQAYLSVFLALERHNRGSASSWAQS